MELIISENKYVKLTICEDYCIFDILNYSDIIGINNNKEIIKYLLVNNEINSYLPLSNSNISYVYQYIVGEIDYNTLCKKYNSEENISLKILMGLINSYKSKYSKLINEKIDCIGIKCDKNSFNEAIDLAMSLNSSQITLYSDSINFKEYYNLLSNLPLEILNNTNIKINISENQSPLSIGKLFKITCILKEKADKINKLNLSPIEKVLYAYDIVKEREYKENKENKYAARNISDVLLGDSIVCVGYTRVMSGILSFFDINAVMLASNKKKHARCLAYIKDNKYNIDGYFMFDPTWDSKKQEEKEDYIEKYNYFAIPVSISNIKVPIESLLSIKLPFEEFVNLLNTETSVEYINNILSPFEELYKMCYDDFEKFYNNIINYYLLSEDEKKKLYHRYNNFIYKLYNSKISIDDFVKILYNVRRLEYYMADVKKIDLESIRESSIRRNISSNFQQLKRFDMIRYIIEYEDCYEYLEGKEEKLISSSLKDNVSTNRDNLNIRLLKVLKKKIDN